MPVNLFKQSLRSGRQQIGLWVGLANTGFDWLLIDAEHAPNDPRSVLKQLQEIAAYPVHPVVRPVYGNVELIKQYLDLGAQTLLVPMVETAAAAARMVAATRHPPEGIRGVGSALARSSRWNQIDNYLQRCGDEMCVIVQVESIKALKNLAAIAAVDGVDGVFFGPADLSASMGLLGKPMDPKVQSAIADGIVWSARSGGRLLSEWPG